MGASVESSRILGTLATVLADWIVAPPLTPLDLPSSAPRMFVADEFSNPQYQIFALKGCLAATICYVTWVGLFTGGVVFGIGSQVYIIQTLFNESTSGELLLRQFADSPGVWHRRRTHVVGRQ